MVLLASSIVINLKQNDKFTRVIVYSFIMIFIIYFISNLLDALGSTSQLHPLISKLLMPLIVLVICGVTFQINELKRKKIL
jgi:lipopolysaccharide export LptBFGC system permease protein LptF